MNKGFTLLEIVVVVAIIMILSAGGVMAIGDRIEKNAALRVKSELPTVIRNAIDKSFSDGISRTVEYNTTEGVISITGTSIGAISYQIPRPLKGTMTPDTFIIGERGDVSGLGAATEAVILVKTKKSEKVIRVGVSNISGLNLGRVVIE
jgi:prepilin-type N-terminal cleavage/methylation domain-containing protein